MTMRYRWRDCELVYHHDEVKPRVVTYYWDHYETGGSIVPDDAIHARLLRIRPIEHRLAHELAHHVVAKALGLDHCPVLWAAAHQLEMPKDADKLEWYYTAITYLAYRKQMRNAVDYGALTDLLAQGVGVQALAEYLCWLIQGASHGGQHTLLMEAA